MSSWPDINDFENGEALSAEVLNRPVYQLAERTAYVKDWLTQAAAGMNQILRNAPISTGVSVGQPVYLDPATAAFDLAYRQLSGTSLSGCGYHWGIVINKSSASAGDILLSGIWTAADLSAAFTGTPTTGNYYLSTTAGKLTKEPLPMSPFVCRYSAELGMALVLPTAPKNQEEHQHLKFSLVTTASVDGSEGWASPGGQTGEPSGAQYRYVVGTNTELANALAAAVSIGHFVRVTGAGWGNTADESTAIYLNEHGIWWMNTSVNPTTLSFPVEVWITCISANTAHVTSLSPAAGSPLKFMNRTGQAAATGDLIAAFDFSLATQEEATYSGPTVVRSIGSKVVTGKVVGSIKSNSSFLTISGESLSGDRKNGDLEINLSIPNVGTFYLQPDLVVYQNADQGTAGMLPYHGLPSAYNSSVTFSFVVPGAAALSFQAALQFKLYGTAAGTFSSLATSRQVASAVAAASEVPAVEALSSIDLTAHTITAPRYVDISKDIGQVAGGSVVTVRLARTSSDGYSGTLGVLGARLVVTATA